MEISIEANPIFAPAIPFSLNRLVAVVLLEVCDADTNELEPCNSFGSHASCAAANPHVQGH